MTKQHRMWEFVHTVPWPAVVGTSWRDIQTLLTIEQTMQTVQ